MFYYSATQKLVNGDKIRLFNYGNMKRDFTYIDDVIEGIYRVIQGAPEKQNGEDGLPLPPYSIYNIGGGQPEQLMEFISILSEKLRLVELLPSSFVLNDHIELVEMQPGDVLITYADSSALENDFDFKPTIGIKDGLRKFAAWYKSYYSK